MFKEDFQPFCKLLDDVSELRGLPAMSASAKALFFRAVNNYTIQQVTFAAQAHLIDPEAGKFKTQLQPAHLVAQIEKAIDNDGRPDGDEAWGIALLATDEAATVVWTEEIAQALASAQPILATGDRTGARMAFKSAYARLVSKARNNAVAVRWSPSLGNDPEQRHIALDAAVSNGLLPAPYIAGLLPPPESASETPDEQARENLKQIMTMLSTALSPSEKTRKERETMNEKERDRLADLKRQSAIRSGQQPLDIWPKSELKQRNENEPS